LILRTTYPQVLRGVIHSRGKLIGACRRAHHNRAGEEIETPAKLFEIDFGHLAARTILITTRGVDHETSAQPFARLMIERILSGR
jgi:hypothetical protein